MTITSNRKKEVMKAKKWEALPVELVIFAYLIFGILYKKFQVNIKNSRRHCLNSKC